MAENGGTDLYSRVFLGHDQGSIPPDETVRLNDSDDAEERAQRVMRDLASAEGPFNAWYGPAKEDNNFYNGHQWDDADRLKMEQSKRPAITFNEIMPAVNAVSGLERLNRSDVRFVTRALDSNALIDLAGDLASEAVATCDDLCNGSEELSRVAKDCVVMGMAWGEIRTSYAEDINGRIVYERIPPEQMRWDPHNQTKENLEDRTWCARKKPISRRLFKQLWGEDKLAAVDLALPDLPFGQTDKYELVTPYYSLANIQANPQVGGAPKKDIEVIQYQWRDMQPLYRFIDDISGEEQHFDQDQWDTLKKRAALLDSEPPSAVKQMQPVYRQGYYCRGVELEEPVDLPGGFSLLCISGMWDENKKRWFGLVRNMIDAQKTKNKAISSSLAFHISNAKGGVLFRPRALDNPRAAQDAWSQPDAWIPVSDDANIKEDIVPRSPSQLPPELPMFYEEAQKAMTSVSGVNAELIGQATGQTPSQTAQSRVQSGLVVLGWFFDNLKRHHKAKATMMLEFVREFWTQGQLIQVGGDATAQAIPLLKESLPDRWHYSLVLDDSIRHNPNLKAQIWSDLTTSGVLQALMKFNLGQVILKLLKYSPFPSQLVQDILRDVTQNPPPPPQNKRGQPGARPGAPGKPPEPPQMVQAKVALHSAQAQKALAQAREIDMRTGQSPAKLTLEALAQSHNQQLEKQQQAHTQGMDQQRARNDATNMLIKARQGAQQHRLNLMNAMTKGMGAMGGLAGPIQPDQGGQGGGPTNQ